MRLTTLARVKNYLGGSSNLDSDDERVLKQIIGSVSIAIAEYLNRNIKSEERTEYLDVFEGQEVFYLKGYPIDQDATFEVYNDVDRAFDTEIDSSDYDKQSGKDSGLLKIDQYTLSAGKGALKVKYTGGLATQTSYMTITCASVTSFTVGRTINGGTSGASGTIVSITNGSTKQMVIDVTAGVFEATETITEEGGSPASTTITTINVTPLVMSHPDIALACEMQVCYNYQRKDQLGVSAISVEGVIGYIGQTCTLQSLTASATASEASITFFIYFSSSFFSMALTGHCFTQIRQPLQ